SWFLASTGIAVSLVVAVGTYQTNWPLVLFVPVALLATGALPWRARRTRKLLSIWYLFALPMMAWCTAISFSYVDSASLSFLEYIGRVWTGFRAATVESILYTFVTSPGLPKSDFSWFGSAALVIAFFAVVLLWFSLGSLAGPEEKSEKPTPIFLILFGVSLAVLGASLLPPSLIYTPTYGTRLIHWAAIGTILGIVVILAWAFRWKAPLGAAISALMALVFFSATICQVFEIRNYRIDNSFLNRRFWEDLTLELPKVKEGTVLLMESSPAGVAASDSVATWVFRALTESQEAFFIFETPPEFETDHREYVLKTTVNLAPGKVDEHRLGGKPYFEDPVFPTVLEEPQAFSIPESRVIWLDWNLESRRLSIDPTRSAMDRIVDGSPHALGRKMFPPATAKVNRERGNDLW
ncbi:MAG: hypothetical protein AAGC68_16700, partial [Verrucomicrobiota bacterium]